MAGQALDVDRGAVDAGKGADETKQPQQAQDSGGPDRRGQGDEVDPVAAQVLGPVVGGEETAGELCDEQGGDREFE